MPVSKKRKPKHGGRRRGLEGKGPSNGSSPQRTEWDSLAESISTMPVQEYLECQRRAGSYGLAVSNEPLEDESCNPPLDRNAPTGEFLWQLYKHLAKGYDELERELRPLIGREGGSDKEQEETVAVRRDWNNFQAAKDLIAQMAAICRDLPVWLEKVASAGKEAEKAVIQMACGDIHDERAAQADWRRGSESAKNQFLVDMAEKEHPDISFGSWGRYFTRQGEQLDQARAYEVYVEQMAVALQQAVAEVPFPSYEDSVSFDGEKVAREEARKVCEYLKQSANDAVRVVDTIAIAMRLPTMVYTRHDIVRADKPLTTVYAPGSDFVQQTKGRINNLAFMKDAFCEMFHETIYQAIYEEDVTRLVAKMSELAQSGVREERSDDIKEAMASAKEKWIEDCLAYMRQRLEVAREDPAIRRRVCRTIEEAKGPEKDMLLGRVASGDSQFHCARREMAAGTIAVGTTALISQEDAPWLEEERLCEVVRVEGGTVVVDTRSDVARDIADNTASLQYGESGALSHKAIETMIGQIASWVECPPDRGIGAVLKTVKESQFGRIYYHGKVSDEGVRGPRVYVTVHEVDELNVSSLNRDAGVRHIVMVVGVCDKHRQEALLQHLTGCGRAELRAKGVGAI